MSVYVQTYPGCVTSIPLWGGFPAEATTAIETKSILKKQPSKDVFICSPPLVISPGNPFRLESSTNPRNLEDFIILRRISYTRHKTSTYLAKDRRTKKHVELSVIPKIEPRTNLTEERERRRKQYRSVRNEQEILKFISEQNAREGRRFAIALCCSWHDTKNFYLVKEWNPTDLAVEITTLQRFSEDQARFYIVELILAIEALRAQGIVHRDIKPSNIQLSADGHIRLAGFRYATRYDPTLYLPPPCTSPDDDQLNNPNYVIEFEVSDDAVAGAFDIPVKQPDARAATRELVPWTSTEQGIGGSGSAYYQTPEQHRGEEYGRDVDLWAVGVILYRMIVGRMPFGNMFSQPQDIRRCVLAETLTFRSVDGVSAQAKSLLRGMLEKDQRKRFTLEKVKKHRFFAGINWSQFASPSHSLVTQAMMPPIIPAIPFLPRTQMEPNPIKVGRPYVALTNPLPGFHYVSASAEMEHPKGSGGPQTSNMVETFLDQKSLGPHLANPSQVYNHGNQSKNSAKVGWWKRVLAWNWQSETNEGNRHVWRPRVQVFEDSTTPLSKSITGSPGSSCYASETSNNTFGSSTDASPPTTPSPAPRKPDLPPMSRFVYIKRSEPQVLEQSREILQPPVQDVQEQELRQLIIMRALAMPSPPSNERSGAGYSRPVYDSGSSSRRRKRESGLRPLILPTLVAQNSYRGTKSPASLSASSDTPSPAFSTASISTCSSVTSGCNSRERTTPVPPPSTSFANPVTRPPSSPVGLGLCMNNFETELTQAIMAFRAAQPANSSRPSHPSGLARGVSSSTSLIPKARLRRMVSWIKTSISAPSLDELKVTPSTTTMSTTKRNNGEKAAHGMVSNTQSRLTVGEVPRISIQDFDKLSGEILGDMIGLGKGQ